MAADLYAISCSYVTPLNLDQLLPNEIRETDRRAMRQFPKLPDEVLRKFFPAPDAPDLHACAEKQFPALLVVEYAV